MYNILLIAAIFGFVLTTLLFLKRSSHPIATFFLGSFYFLLSVYALQAYIIDGGHLAKSSWFFLWPLMPYNLFAVPVYFYFVTIMADEFKWKKEYLLLFLPFILSVIDAAYIYAQPDTVYTEILHNAINNPKNRLRASYWLLDLDEHMFLRHLWQLAALLFLLPKLLRFLKEENGDDLKVILNKWLLVFWFGLTLFAVFAIFYAVGNMVGRYIFEDGAIIPIALYLIMFLVGVIPIYFPSILRGYPKDIKLNSQGAHVPGTKENNKFGLQELGVESQLELLIDRKIYLKQDFNLTNLARELEIPAHQLSYFIKQQYGLNFTAFKNNLRMDYGKQLIQEGFLSTNTMDALALECGFANRSSFSKAFKNTTTLSPSEFDHKIKNNP